MVGENMIQKPTLGHAYVWGYLAARFLKSFFTADLIFDKIKDGFGFLQVF